MAETDLEALLWEDESAVLDFKREQYRFEGASDEEKSELLKDVLAFSNAHRRTDAYILIGVEELRGSRSRPVGVATHLDDANLQQFVNSKVQKPILFSYRVSIIDGKELGVICIPLQTPPYFLRRDFGRLKQNVVYIRHGSSTAIADPDEVVRLAKPSQIDLQIARLRQRAQQEWSAVDGQALSSIQVSFKHRLEKPPEELIDYLSKVRIRIFPDPDSLSEHPVTLRFTKVADVDDLEAAFGLIAERLSRSVAASKSLSFWRKGRVDDHQLVTRVDQTTSDERAPNEITETQARLTQSGPTYVTGISMICDGWTYTSSNEDVWVGPDTLACGVDGSIAWKELASDGAGSIVNDIRRLERVSISLPYGFDLRPADEFELTWSTSGGKFIELNFAGLRYAENPESRTWNASITGPVLHAQLADAFVAKRERQLLKAEE